MFQTVVRFSAYLGDVAKKGEAWRRFDLQYYDMYTVIMIQYVQCVGGRNQNCNLITHKTRRN